MKRSYLSFALSSLTLLGLVAGCGSNDVSGTIGGKSVDVKSVISGPYGKGTKNESYVVMMSNEEDLCAKLDAGGLQNPPNFQMLWFALVEADLTTGQTKIPQDTGTFTVFSTESASLPSSNKLATVFYMETDANGASLSDGLIVGTKGSIILDDIGSDGALAGEGEFTLSTGDALSIEYDATACSAISNFDTSGSSSDPNAPAAAWTFTYGSEAECGAYANTTDMYGEISATKVTSTLSHDERNGLRLVSCSIEPNYLYGETYMSLNENDSKRIQANINWVAGATKANPAKGTLGYSNAGIKFASMECDFYLVEGSAQSVSTDKFWIAYDCPLSVEFTTMGCSSAEGYLYFENCSSMP